MQTCKVFNIQGDYLGRVYVTETDWRGSTNWRQAALKAACRVYGRNKESFYVVADVYQEEIQ